MSQSGSDKPGSDKPGSKKPGTDKPGTNKPGTDKPGTDKPSTDKPGSNKSGTDKPVTDKPGSNNPGSKPRLDNLGKKLRETSLDSGIAVNKHDLRKPNLGSPISTLRTQVGSGPGPTTSSSSSSSGSVSSQRIRVGSRTGRIYHSGEFPGSVESSPKWSKQDQSRPDPVPIIPAGNICPSGGILKTGMASRSTKTDVVGSGTGNYGYGSIMRGGGAASNAPSGADAEELKRMGNEKYNKRNYLEAVGFYDRAIGILPNNATYRFNKAMALTGLKRIFEAVREFEEAIRLDRDYVKAHHRLGSLFIRLGQIENARMHLSFPSLHPDPSELNKIQAVETKLIKCTNCRKVNDWKNVLREADAAITAGADSSPQLYACKAEAFLKLQQLEEANNSLSNVPKSEDSNPSSSQSKFFGMLSVAYLFFVRAQIEMAFGRFESAVSLAEKALAMDPQNIEVSVLVKNVRLASRARVRGNDLFKSERFTEAFSAYSEGLRFDPSNSVLYSNRAACWYKLGKWENSLDDCSRALKIQPNYTKALLRRAASSTKLERWAEAVRDYEALRRELPHDNEVAENLFHAQVALRKSRGEVVSNMKFGGEVELVSGLEQFKAVISSPGVSIVHFKTATNIQCKQISPFLDTLCGRYPTINFLKVDVEQSQTIATAENVRIVPTFKIYRNGRRVKEMVCPSPEVLESSVRHYSL